MLSIHLPWYLKEHDRDIRFARTETSAVSEHAHNTGHKPLWNEVKFIDRDPHYYTRRVKEAIIHIRFHPDNINRDSGIEIPEAWMPTIKKHNNRRAMQQQTAEGANHWVKQRGSKCTNQSCWKPTNHSRAACFIRSRMTSRPHRLKKTSSIRGGGGTPICMLYEYVPLWRVWFSSSLVWDRV